jgi:hypothetical protein
MFQITLFDGTSNFSFHFWEQKENQKWSKTLYYSLQNHQVLDTLKNIKNKDIIHEQPLINIKFSTKPKMTFPTVCLSFSFSFFSNYRENISWPKIKREKRKIYLKENPLIILFVRGTMIQDGLMWVMWCKIMAN